MRDHYLMMADYNGWANRLVYEAVATLSESEFQENKGAFFGSLSGTLNHLLATDRIWMRRFTGTGDAPTRLDAVIHTEFAALADARRAEDERIAGWIRDLTEEDLRATFSYTPVSTPTLITQKLAPALAHLFNHQTHHRGQCHMILTALGKPSLSLDLVFFQRTPEGRKHAG
ncbi:putative damage-inducible protein DinB [Pararhizobium capsulatum DSM 1112]|uniref:Damage-inducible protein DinB n=1 Tax=Pararhizobium capsulatum DSM 1112 TaxID=1121113 RepID=A0ABU0BNE7_9HYPH|nr:DinB family protein [Pararhizobium capsulatum]MDQ0319786.1 putative damage-inducible protein DinB [Pararhizobium capsulatum DSM 1112]